MAPYVTSDELDLERPVELTATHLTAAAAAFFRIADAWGLSSDQAAVLLGRPSRATLFNWKRGEVRKLPYDTVRRISYVLGVWKALQILFPIAERADTWIRQPNALLGGHSALERMLAGDVTDLAAVRALLDGARGQGA